MSVPCSLSGYESESALLTQPSIDAGGDTEALMTVNSSLTRFIIMLDIWLCQVLSFIHRWSASYSAIHKTLADNSESACSAQICPWNKDTLIFRGNHHQAELKDSAAYSTPYQNTLTIVFTAPCYLHTQLQDHYLPLSTSMPPSNELHAAMAKMLQHVWGSNHSYSDHRESTNLCLLCRGMELWFGLACKLVEEYARREREDSTGRLPVKKMWYMCSKGVCLCILFTSKLH